MNFFAFVLKFICHYNHKYSGEMTPREYIHKVKHKDIFDPVLTFQLANDFNVKRVIRDYAPEDRESASIATLLQWDIFITQSPMNPASLPFDGVWYNGK